MVAFLALAAVAEACSCKAPPPPKEALAAADAVFSGKCVNVEIEGGLMHVTLEVDRVWKGEVAAAVVVTTASSGDACGYAFTTKGDATYLVYARVKNGALSTNMCTRTKQLSAAKGDIAELGDGGKPKVEKKEEKK